MPPIFRPFTDLRFPEIQRRNLPHWQTPGATYFLTFRLADSIPAGAVREIQASSNAWLRVHGLKNRKDLELLSESKKQEYRRVITQAEERWLDAGYGACLLRMPHCREIRCETMRHFDGDRYALDAFVIMPNHVHALVQPIGEHADIASSWKKFSARQINRLLNRDGQLWMIETFDHIVRAWDRMEQFRRYIEENPKKAGLRPGEYHVGRGSGISEPFE